MEVGNPSALQLQNFTIEAWVKRASSSVVSLDFHNSGVIFCHGWGGFGLSLHHNRNPFLTQVGSTEVTCSLAITDTNNYHHVAVTKNGSTVVFYVDGIAETAPAYNPTFVFNGSAAVGATGGSHEASLLGSLDEVSVYNRALSGSEIQAIYNSGSSGKCSTPTAPLITSHPQDQTAPSGTTVSFSVTASGTQPLSYQWLFNGTNIGGATASSLMLSNVQAANAGLY